MDINKIFSDSIASAIRSGAFVSRRILVIPLLTKMIGLDSYGIWVTLFSFTTLTATLGRLHMNGALIRYSGRDESEGKVFAGTLLITLIFSFLSSVVLVMFIQATHIFSGTLIANPSTRWLSIIGLLAFFTSLWGYISNYPRAKNRVKEYEIITLLELILEVIALVITVYITRSLFWGVLSVVAVLASSTTVCLIYYATTNLSLPSITSTRKFLTYAVPVVPKEFSGIILTHADKLLILYFITPTAAGGYAIAYTVANLFRTATGVLNPTLYPSVAGAWDAGDILELESLYDRIIRLYTILAVPSLVGLSVLSPAILEILASENAANQAGSIVPILGFGLLLQSYDDLLTHIITAAEKTVILGVATGGAAVVNVILNFVLIPRYGLFGASLATFITEVLILSITFYYIQDLVRIQLPRVLIIKIIFSSILMGGAISLISTEFSPIVAVVLIPPVGAGIYFMIMFVIGGVTSQNINDVLDAV